MTKPTADTALTALSLLGSTAQLSALVAAWRRSRAGATMGTATSMVITLLAWRRYALIWETSRTRR